MQCLSPIPQTYFVVRSKKPQFIIGLTFIQYELMFLKIEDKSRIKIYIIFNIIILN